LAGPLCLTVKQEKRSEPPMLKTVQRHFREIAPSYSKIRTTDLEPVNVIRKQLQNRTDFLTLEVGCGNGRYTVKLLDVLPSQIEYTCIDINTWMLEYLKKNLELIDRHDVRVMRASAEKLPFPSQTVDVILTFNAIHHFDIPVFLNESARTLNDGGYLFIYTRLKRQNARHIWGKYFPLFHAKETRLRELEDFKHMVKRIPRLRIASVKKFRFARQATFDRLIEQVKHRHYSTFDLYAPVEFRRAFSVFKKNLHTFFKDQQHIGWVDENTLIIVRKKRTNTQRNTLR